MTDVAARFSFISDVEPAHLEARYPARMLSIRLAREAVATLAKRCGTSQRQVDDIRLAVSEAVTNVVRHAYAHGLPGSFSVSAVVSGHELQVLVEDEGCGLSVDPVDPGLGLGLSIMHAVATRALICERPGGGTMVKLAFGLEPAAR